MPATERKPFIFVLAGVNGGGKSSVGGAIVTQHGLSWFNPDAYARELVNQLGLELSEANGRAWAHGVAQLQAALDARTNFAFETTLGGNTIHRLLALAKQTHDVVMLFCGLQTPEQHLQRVKLRVAHGGHDIPEHKIRTRWDSSRANLIKLLPTLTHLQVFDNSTDAVAGDNIPDPRLLLEMAHGKVVFPPADDVSALMTIPDWARPIVQAALECAPQVHHNLSPRVKQRPQA
ncbi:hypothetical protein SJI19_15400 [Acerihabitans sp. TG2]|uniref:hypothetical protein n=1 Tax=Acerihabitans sp. TG2 TaxID=3096008 RepID=UPI002B239152|nr:hypothetical protein [Acerihabitans sp. TG2]MEA9391912.1 hypothetical protein [Acerihabitans sp. TG2]